MALRPFSRDRERVTCGFPWTHRSKIRRIYIDRCGFLVCLLAYQASKSHNMSQLMPSSVVPTCLAGSSLVDTPLVASVLHRLPSSAGCTAFSASCAQVLEQKASVSQTEAPWPNHVQPRFALPGVRGNWTGDRVQGPYVFHLSSRCPLERVEKKCRQDMYIYSFTSYIWNNTT